MLSGAECIDVWLLLCCSRVCLPSLPLLSLSFHSRVERLYHYIGMVQPFSGRPGYETKERQPKFLVFPASYPMIVSPSHLLPARRSDSAQALAERVYPLSITIAFPRCRATAIEPSSIRLI